MIVLNPGDEVYVSGPMSGYSNFNIIAFDIARNRLLELGLNPIIPGDGEVYSVEELATQRARPANRAVWLRADYNDILSVRAVIVLDGWAHSPGARGEVMVAQHIGIPVLHWDTMELVEAKVVTMILTDA
jgi:hypothetical protein